MNSLRHSAESIQFLQMTTAKFFLHAAVLTVGFLVPGVPAFTAEVKPAALKEAFREQFKIGTAINRAITSGQGFRRTPDQVAADIALVKAQFNQVVAENEMKWGSIHPRPGKDGYDFTAADAFVGFGEANGMELAGHTLVWHSQTPNWVFEGTHSPEVAPAVPPPEKPLPETVPGPPAEGASNPAPGGDGRRRFGGRGGFRPFDLNGPRASREELLERMRGHIHTVVGRYKGKIKVWDVVNEAIADNGPDILRKSPWSIIIGPDFIEKAFEYAHEADPDAILRYNDYGLEDPGKRAKLIRLIKSLQEKKVPVMAIGTQAHLNVSINFDKMDRCLTEIAALGLPIHVTELDVNSATGGQRGTGADIAGNASATQGGLVEEANRRLTEAYTGIFRAFIKHCGAVSLVTFWGPNDGNSWRAQGKPLLFDAEGRPKPAFEAVIKLAEDASTKAP